MALAIASPASHAEWQLARQLFDEYTGSLGIDLSFQDIAREREQLEIEYGPPAGAFLLARDRQACLGCVGLRRFAADAGEIKRLYVVPAARRLRLGRQLAMRIISIAHDLGYRRLLLDTLPAMQHAQALYRSLGFSETTPYRFNPVPGTVFLALRLE